MILWFFGLVIIDFLQNDVGSVLSLMDWKKEFVNLNIIVVLQFFLIIFVVIFKFD